MKKRDILKLIVGAAGVIDPRIALATHGIEALIHRDTDPTNDVEETATALTDIVLNTIGVTEDASGKEFFDNELGAQLAANIKGDILLAIQVFRQRRQP